MQITASWASRGKWAVRDSGDAVVLLASGSERVVAVIVDVQGAGSGAKATAWSLAALGSQLAGEGADAASLATQLSRALCTRRGGRVQASLGVLAWESGHAPTAAVYGSVVVVAAERSGDPPCEVPSAAGLDMQTTPRILEHPSDATWVAMCSDGIAATAAEARQMATLDASRPPSASALLAQAEARVRGRPRDDMSVVVLSIDTSVTGAWSVDGELRIGGPPGRPAKDIGDATAAPE